MTDLARQTANAVASIAAQLTARGLYMVTAESCTGGGIAAACTDLSGSSAWFERGWVTYANAAKTQDLGVAESLIQTHGAVSEPVAAAMARGAQARAGVGVSVATTGIAGPTGGTAAKPVGLVWFAWCVGDQLWTEQQVFSGDRAAIRAAAVAHALSQLQKQLAQHN
jgi:nicotinamide-nucleotide amidase